jgi:hypothetical protein
LIHPSLSWVPFIALSWSFFLGLPIEHYGCIAIFPPYSTIAQNWYDIKRTIVVLRFRKWYEFLPGLPSIFCHLSHMFTQVQRD